MSADRILSDIEYPTREEIDRLDSNPVRRTIFNRKSRAVGYATAALATASAIVAPEVVNAQEQPSPFAPDITLFQIQGPITESKLLEIENTYEYQEMVGYYQTFAWFINISDPQKYANGEFSLDVNFAQTQRGVEALPILRYGDDDQNEAFIYSQFDGLLKISDPLNSQDLEAVYGPLNGIQRLYLAVGDEIVYSDGRVGNTGQRLQNLSRVINLDLEDPPQIPLDLKFTLAKTNLENINESEVNENQIVASAIAAVNGNLRSGEGKNFDHLGSLEVGAQYSVLNISEAPDTDGFRWLKLLLENGQTAYAREDLFSSIREIDPRDLQNPPVRAHLPQEIAAQLEVLQSGQEIVSEYYNGSIRKNAETGIIEIYRPQLHNPDDPDSGWVQEITRWNLPEGGFVTLEAPVDYFDQYGIAAYTDISQEFILNFLSWQREHYNNQMADMKFRVQLVPNLADAHGMNVLASGQGNNGASNVAQIAEGVTPAAGNEFFIRAYVYNFSNLEGWTNQQIESVKGWYLASAIVCGFIDASQKGSAMPYDIVSQFTRSSFQEQLSQLVPSNYWDHYYYSPFVS